MLKTFSYPGDLNEFFTKLQDSLYADHRTFSEYLVELCLEDSKKRYPKIGAPELLKALQERDQGPTEAEQHGARVHVERLEQLTSKKWPNIGVQRDKLTSRIQKALDFNERAKVPELSAAIERARSFAEKLGDLSKRGS